MKRRWQRVLGWVLVVKVIYVGLVCTTLWLFPDMDIAKFYNVMMRWPRVGKPVFASHFATWDAAHYLFLSEVGYGPGVRSNAFYPLWPLLIRWCSIFTKVNDLILGMVLANAFSAAGWVLFHRVAAGRFGERTANWALVWLIAFPGSLFYQFIYSESLFVLLVMGLWFGLEREKYGVAWVSALLMPLARAVGVFSVLPIAWHILVRWPLGPMRHWKWMKREREAVHPSERQTHKTSAPCNGTAAPAACTWLLVAPLLGWTIYCALMATWTGDPFSGVDAQKYWGAHSVANLWNVRKFVIGWFEPTDWHAFKGSMLDRLAFLLLLYTLPVIWRLGKDLVVWAYVLAILSAMSGTFVSYIRFASLAFPMFIALAVFCESRHSTWMRWGLLTGFGVLHVILLWRFVNFRWAG